MNEVNALGFRNQMDCTFLDYQYHAEPERLHSKVQELILESQTFDLIILTYGRCSNSVVGLISPQVPLLLPATHDCIGLLMGSNNRYLEFFRENSLTYYFSQGWLDYGRTPYAEYLEYLEKYPEKKARKIMELLYGHYKEALLIITPGMDDVERYRLKVKESADFLGWKVREIYGDLELLHSLLQGKQGRETCLIEAGQAITLKDLAGGNYENND